MTDTLVVRSPTYHSRGDEEAFFWWLNHIRAVAQARSRGLDVHITLRPGTLSSDERRELRALFHRYGMDTTALGTL